MIVGTFEIQEMRNFVQNLFYISFCIFFFSFPCYNGLMSFRRMHQTHKGLSRRVWERKGFHVWHRY